MIVDQLAKKENLTVSVEEVSAAIARQAEAMGQPVVALERWFASSPERLKMVEREVIRTKVLDLLESRAHVEYMTEPLPSDPSSDQDDASKASAIEAPAE